jgi:hypothetical protein
LISDILAACVTHDSLALKGKFLHEKTNQSADKKIMSFEGYEDKCGNARKKVIISI